MNNTSSESLSTIDNTTLTTSLMRLRDSQYLGWIITVLLTNTLGTLVNILLLLALVIHRPLRRSSSCALIAHCVVIDLYTTAVTVPTATIPVYLSATYNLPKHFCKYQSLFIFMAYGAGMYASSILAIHRLVATIFPRYFKVLTRKPIIACMIVLPWIVTMTLNVFPAVESGLKLSRANSSGGCSYISTRKNENGPIFLYTIFGTYFPTAVMGISYLIVLLKTSIDLRAKRVSQALRRRLEISRMLFLSFLWHCIAIYPIIILITFFPKELAANVPLLLVSRWMSNSFSAINPVCVPPFRSSRIFFDDLSISIHFFFFQIFFGQVAECFRTELKRC
jgi:hypothetical protein